MRWHVAILTDSELDAAREDVAGMLPDTGYILTRTITPDGFGGNTTSWGTASVQPCRLDYKTGSERLSGGARQTYTGWMITLPWDAVVTTSNQIKINGTSYNVKSVDTGKSWTISKRCEVEKI
jgi:hypothetical protein